MTAKLRVKTDGKRGQGAILPGRQALLVLGMHRSGTSALSGLLVRLGAAAPRSPLPTNEFNERGYWESHKLAILHDRILAQVGSTWDDWQKLGAGWMAGVEESGLASELRQALVDEYGESPLFVVKDPRVSRFVPLWLRMLEQAHVAPKVLISVRHPGEVAKSLKRRDHMGRAESLLVWIRHLLDAEYETRSVPRVIVRYEGLLQDWRDAASRIGRTLSIDWPNWNAKTEADIDEFISEDLRHHRDGADFAKEEGQVDQWARIVHGALDDLARGRRSDGEVFKELDKVRIEFDRMSEVFGPALMERRMASRKEFMEMRVGLESRVKQQEERVQELSGAVAEMERRAVRAENDARSRAVRTHVLQEEMEKQRQRIAEIAEGYGRKESELGAQVRTQQGCIQELEAKLQHLERSAAAAERRVDELNSAHEALLEAKSTIGSLSARLEEGASRLAANQEALSEAQARIEGLAHELAETKRASASQLGEWTRERRRLEDALGVRFRELASLAIAMEKQREDLLATQARLETKAASEEDLRRQLASSRRELDAACGRNDELGREIEAVKERNEVLRRQLTASDLARQAKEKDVAELRADVARLCEEQDMLRNESSDTKDLLAWTSSALESARSELDRVLDSNTWKMGRPLRVLRRMLSGRPSPRTNNVDVVVARIRASGVFDEAWYLDRYADVRILGLDPVRHYVQYGCSEGRDPSPGFSTGEYYKENPDAVGTNALLHFVENRMPING